MKNQVIEWKLPHAPAKEGDSRTANWGGLGQVELDAIEPKKLQRLCQNAINQYFDDDLYNELKELETTERVEYRENLIEFVNGLKQ
jgi:hypothetical protein